MKKCASYYKCALQVNSSGYAKFRGDTPEQEQTYNEQILAKCKSNNITVVGLADHGCVDSSESLRKYLVDNGMVAFPGFEISTAEKIHIVCLFSPEMKSSELNRVLGSLGLTHVEVGTEVSDKTCMEIADKVAKVNGFWYAAHISGDNGILKLGKNQHIWTDGRLLAAQIPDSRENIDPKYANIIKNTDSQYKRSNEIALINASDIERPIDLDKDNSSVLVKMSEPSFENFCMAFKDPESRIRLNSERENNYQSRFTSIAVFGGYLDGFQVDLSENLTTIIGGRGTGKSTLINIIRYALGKEPIGKEAKSEFNEMIQHNLGTLSRVELKIISNSQHGQMYTIKRRFKQNPVITDKDGTVSPLSVDDVLPFAEIYGQNEIMQIARDKSKIREVAARLFHIDKQMELDIDEAHRALVENGITLVDLETEECQNTSSLDELPALLTKLGFYKDASIEKDLEVIKKLSTEEGQFNAIKKLLPKKELGIHEISVEEYENKELQALSEDIERYNATVKKMIADYKVLSEQLEQSYSKHRENWDIKKAEYDGQLKASLKAIEGVQDKSSQEIVTEYSNLIKKVEESKPLEKKKQALEAKKADALSKRKGLVEKYKQCCDKRDAAMRKCIKKINKDKLHEIVQLSILPHQNKTPVHDKLTQIQGIGEKAVAGIDEYQDFDVFTFAEDVKNGADCLKKKYSLTPNAAEKIVTGLQSKDLREIEEMELEDIVVIKLWVNGKYKKLSELSKGQQCTAILNLLLLDNKDPLVIDQPEDNLDNSFIAENLVKTLRENKIKRQYILATHNANIPVFGDAEQIITMEEDSGYGRIAENGLGSIDDSGVKSNVINILEGGTAAFRMREAKYGI